MKRDDADLEGHEALMQFLYRAPVGLVQAALDGTIEMINPMAASLLLPLSRDGDLGNLFSLLDRADPTLRARTAAFDRPSGAVCEGLRLVPGVEGGPAALSLNLLKFDGDRLMAMVSDITLELQREQEGIARRLDAAARLDPLTRLPNRVVAVENVAAALARGGDFAVLTINGDRFRQVNDALGHAAGDELLRLIAERLRSTLRRRGRDGAQPCETAARLGGDEFLVLLDDLRDLDDAQAVAHRLLDVLGQPYGIQGRPLHCTISIGIVHGRGDAPDAEAVLRDAGIAMMEAKRAGGHRLAVFEPAMRRRVAQRNAMENDLRRALREEQLFVVYQPVVGLGPAGTDPCAGVEALVRWRHPEHGIVPPLDFIGVAEECGLIGALGEFVLARACRDFAHWRLTLGDRAPRLLAVNLSRRQLAQPGFVDAVKLVLTACGMPPGCLQLEVTESLAAQDESVRARLRELKDLGLTLALDDFGTGYSSLSSLHLLPVDTVKIDRSFVNEAVTSAHHRVLIEATVRVARSLGMGTVAEGIETDAQASIVRDMGCDKGQGYLFSRPLPADELVRWLAGAPPA